MKLDVEINSEVRSFDVVFKAAKDQCSTMKLKQTQCNTLKMDIVLKITPVGGKPVIEKQFCQAKSIVSANVCFENRHFLQDRPDEIRKRSKTIILHSNILFLFRFHTMLKG